MSKLNFRNARFLTSAPTLAECPPETGVEVAFAGRSNAGKSSAINCLTGNSKLARTSKTPGRTQQINFFSLEQGADRRLVDLPGYGYAEVPLAMKKAWQRHLSDYLRARQCLRGLVLLMDIRHPLRDFDAMMLNWALEADMPVHILLTKADKLKRGAANKQLQAVRRHLAQSDEALFSVQLFSSLKRNGVDELTSTLEHWMHVEEDREVGRDIEDEPSKGA